MAKSISAEQLSALLELESSELIEMLEETPDYAPPNPDLTLSDASVARIECENKSLVLVILAEFSDDEGDVIDEVEFLIDMDDVDI